MVIAEELAVWTGPVACLQVAHGMEQSQHGILEMELLINIVLIHNKFVVWSGALKVTT